MTPARRASRPLGPLAQGVLARVSEARAAYLHATGRDFLWAEIGRAVGWTQPTTSAIKTGRRAITLDEIPAIARALGVREAWLALGEGAMRAEAATPAASSVGPVARAADALPDVPPPARRGTRRRA